MPSSSLEEAFREALEEARSAGRPSIEGRR
jgi:hypothetical protein